MPKADAPVSPRQRGPALESLRNQKMARSALDYARGSPMQFYEWLEKGSAAIPQGPEVWICGDCHVGNLGPVANADGRFKVEIRDFDQTVIGNPAHDLIRLGLSLAAAAVVSDLPGLTIAEILEAMIAQYEAAFTAASDKPGHLEEPKTIRKVNQRAADASWTTLAAEDMDGQNFKLPLGRSFWPLLVEERREIERLFRSEEIQRLVTEGEGRDDDADVRVIDAAYWKKGCSSLGYLRYAVLLQIGYKSDHRRHCLLDFKEAVRPRAPHAPGGMPRDYARRVVTGASHLSPFLGSRMQAVEITGKPVFVRELLPQDLKIEIHVLDRKEAARVAGYWRRSWGRRTGGKCSATNEGRGIRNCGATVRKRSMRPHGSGGALSISSWSISAAILSTAVQCHRSLESGSLPLLPFVPHLLGRFLPQPHIDGLIQQLPVVQVRYVLSATCFGST